MDRRSFIKKLCYIGIGVTAISMTPGITKGLFEKSANDAEEPAQDDSCCNIDAEAELTKILSEQIAAEIDREFLRMIEVPCPVHYVKL